MAPRDKNKRETMRRIISENLLSLRQQKYPGRGGSKKCADEMGYKQQQWSPWEKGTRIPSEESLTKIARFFDVPVEYLVTDHSTPQPAAHHGGWQTENRAAPDRVAGAVADAVSDNMKRQIAANLCGIKAILKVELSIVDVEFVG